MRSGREAHLTSMESPPAELDLKCSGRIVPAASWSTEKKTQEMVSPIPPRSEAEGPNLGGREEVEPERGHVIDVPDINR
jgi:hypothetical protein